MWIGINREIEAFMTISITHYTIVTTLKNIPPTSLYSSENYCFTTKPHSYKSSWYIIHVSTGFCAFFFFSSLQIFLEYSGEIHLSGAKQSFVFPSPPRQKAITRCQCSEQRCSLNVCRTPLYCHIPVSSPMSDKLPPPSSLHVCNINSRFVDPRVFFKCVSVELKQCTQFFPGEITDGWLNGDIHPLLWLSGTNISIAAGGFTYANELRAACQDGSPILKSSGNQGFPPGSVSGCAMATAETELWVHSRACWIRVILPPVSAPRSLTRNMLHSLGRQFGVWCKWSEILASNHCRHLGDPCLTWKANRTPYPRCPTQLWSILHVVPSTAAEGALYAQGGLLHLFFPCPFHVPTLFCTQHITTERFL